MIMCVSPQEKIVSATTVLPVKSSLAVSSSPVSKEIDVVQIRDQLLFLLHRLGSRSIEDILKGDGIQIEGIVQLHCDVGADEDLIHSVELVAMTMALAVAV